MAVVNSITAAGAAMLLCGLASVLVPARAADVVRAPVGALFAPVAAPVQRCAQWVATRVMPPAARVDANTPESTQPLLDENAALRVQLANLAGQVEELKKLNIDRQQLGDLRSRCVPARVVGWDAGGRQMVLVSPTMPVPGRAAVITTKGLVGMVVEGPTPGAVRVRLTTDSDSRLQVGFARFERGADGVVRPRWLDSEPGLAVGDGRGNIRIDKLSLRHVETTTLVPGDWVVVNDPELPKDLIGYLVGRVTAIERSRSNPLMAEIVLEPALDFRSMREVMLVKP
jgi:cell shape-determining protein MreC